MSEARHRIGLSWFEVEQRRKCRPPTPIMTGRARLWWRLFLEKFDDPLVRLLAATAGLSFLVGLPQGETTEGLAVLAMIMTIALLGLAGEWMALRQFTSSLEDPEQNWFTTIRDGEPVPVALGDLVPDDCILLEPGDRIPADGVLLDQVDFEVAPPLPSEAEGREGDRPAIRPADSRRPRAGMVVTAGRALWRLSAWPDVPSPERVLESAWRLDRTSPLWQQTEAFVGWFPPIGVSAGLGLFLVLGFTEVGGVSAALPRGAFWLLGSLGAGLAMALASWWVPRLYRSLAGMGFELSAAHPPWPPSHPDIPADDRRLGLMTTGFLLLVGIAAGLLPADPRAWMTMAGLQALLSMAMLVLAILVAVVPDGLGMHVVLGLVWTVRQMARAGLRVRRLQIAETLGGIDTLCHDLDGTLTRLQPRVDQVLLGTRPVAALDSPAGDRLGRAIAATCSESRICRAPGQPPIILGDPLAGALLLWLHDHWPNHRQEGTWTIERVAGEGGWTSALVRPAADSAVDDAAAPGGATAATADQRSPAASQASPTDIDPRSWPEHVPWLFVRGPATAVARICTDLDHETSGHGDDDPAANGNRRSADLAALIRRFEEAEARGETWLGLAGRPWPEAPFRPTLPGRACRHLRWLGAVALEDTPAEGYPTICQTLTQAGIEVTILTDHPLPVVRRAIAAHGPTLQACAPRIMTSQDEDGKTSPMTSARPGQNAVERSDGLPESPADTSSNRADSGASADIEPAPPDGQDRWGATGTTAGSLTRALLVRQLRERGRRVAVIGWRAEDVPALAESQVGIALGPAAPQRVREASDAIIPDGSLHSLVRAIALGRTFFRNIRRYLVFQTVVNGLILGANLLGPLFGLGIPFTALQMLWGHFLLDSVAALALATESPDPDVLEGPPTDVTTPLFTWAMAKQALIMGGWAVAGLLALMAALPRVNLPGGQAASIHFSAFVFFILWMMWMARWSGTRTPHANRAWDNPWALGLLAGTMVAQMAFVQLGGRLFHTAPLSERSWLLLLAGTGLFAWAGAALTDRLTGRPSLVVGERIP